MRLTRRYLTFSLRTLIVLTTALAVWLGVVVNRAREQREAVNAIEALGGAVAYDWHFFETPEQRSVMERATVQLRTWLRRIVGEDLFQEVDHVYLTMPVADALTFVPSLKRIRKLRYIVIYSDDSTHLQNELKAALPACEVYLGSSP